MDGGCRAFLVGILIAVNIILLAAGNFMEPSSIVLIMAPILFPVAVETRD